MSFASSSSSTMERRGISKKEIRMRIKETSSKKSVKMLEVFDCSTKRRKILLQHPNGRVAFAASNSPRPIMYEAVVAAPASLFYLLIQEALRHVPVKEIIRHRVRAH